MSLPEVESGPFRGNERLGRNTGEAALSLFFRPDERPDEAGFETALGEARSGRAVARISHRSADETGRVELLCSGMTFDVAVLTPGAPCDAAISRIRYGFEPERDLEPLQAITIAPGPHLASAGGMPSVVRAMCGIAASVIGPLAVQAVGYGPAQTLMEPGYFMRVSETWLKGGPFPALGLTALLPNDDGSVRSQGLAHFLGQELQVQPASGDAPATTLRTAIRLVDHLMRSGVPNDPIRIELGDEGAVFVEPSRFGKLLLVWCGA
ncbi:hypothetical protein [Novosphingobium aquimarinum]|uniref:hypothetical protein n=1 Tax=Novosphingobium aquimarinum TaxID=2682494 RepID=UPI0012EB4026|nr:hypothetical protein [Novosphingobium aquimarinum]